MFKKLFVYLILIVLLAAAVYPKVKQLRLESDFAHKINIKLQEDTLTGKDYVIGSNRQRPLSLSVSWRSPGR